MDTKTSQIEALKLKHTRLLKEADAQLICFVLSCNCNDGESVMGAKDKVLGLFNQCAEIENHVAIIGMQTN
jgi:hypothetical protein